MKFDKETMNKGGANDLATQGGLMGYYSTASLINNATNTSALKTAKPKKTTRLKPSKIYLAEMQPIKVLVKLTQDGIEIGYAKSQITLSRDVINNIKGSENLSKSLKMANTSENQVSKDAQKSSNTPNRCPRGLVAEPTESKADREEVKTVTKSESVKESAVSKDGYETPRSSTSKNNNTQLESPLQLKGTENQLDTSLKEDIDDLNIEVIMHILFEESRHLFKKTQANKVIRINIADSKLTEFLENNTAEIRGCRICECTYQGVLLDHFSTKSHIKVRDELGLKEQEDLALSPIILTSKPGSIDLEIQKLQENSMKLKYKKIKQQMINKGVSHDVAAATGKDITTAHNKKAMQILSIELENKISPTITDYTQLENKLNSLISILSRKRQEELHLLRKLKIIPWVTEICKKISV